MTGARAWTCRDGDWFGVLGPEIAVLLPPEEKDRAVVVWSLVDDGAGADEVLDALLRDGLQRLSGFVLVSRSGGAGGTTRVLVRGSADVRLGGPEGESAVTADPARTWVEESRDGVASVSVSLPGPVSGLPAPPGGAALLSVARGLVRVGAVELAPAGDVEAPVSPLPAPFGPFGPSGPAEPTGPRRTEDSADAGPPTEAWSLPGDGPSDRADAAPQAAPSRPAGGGPVARLLFSSGDVADVDRVVLVGRAPDAGRVRSGDGPGAEPLLVSVPSPHQGISSTHLEVRPGAGPDLGLAVVTDLGSTNGTVLVQPGLPPEDLKAGVGVQLIAGAVIDLGDGVSIRVVDP